jgi:hypothetical protein
MGTPHHPWHHQELVAEHRKFAAANYITIFDKEGSTSMMQMTPSLQSQEEPSYKSGGMLQ